MREAPTAETITIISLVTEHTRSATEPTTHPYLYETQSYVLLAAKRAAYLSMHVCHVAGDGQATATEQCACVAAQHWICETSTAAAWQGRKNVAGTMIAYAESGGAGKRTTPAAPGRD